MKKVVKILIYIAVTLVVLVVPFVLSLIQKQICFHHSLSFWSAYTSYCSVIIMAYLSFAIYTYNKRKDVEKEKMEKILERPIIVFNKTKSTEYYWIKNIGKGAALNITVKSHLREDKIWVIAHKCYSLGCNEELEMTWTVNCNAIGTQYFDVFHNEYCSYMDNDEIRIFNPKIEEEKKLYSQEYKKIMLSAKETKWFTK